MFKYFCFFLVSTQIAFNPVNTLSVSNKGDSESEDQLAKLRTIRFDDFCGKTLNEPQFLLESPKYPDPYPSNFNCELTLKGPSCPSYYKFRFIHFSVESSNGCVNDRLEIDFVDALCGEKNGTKTYLAKNGTLTIRFKTNGEISTRGFRTLVTRIEECERVPKDSSRTLKKNVGNVPNHVTSNLKQCCLNQPQHSKHFTFKTPNFPASLSYPQDCLLQIQKASPDICRLRIVFHFFWFGNSVDCTEGFIQIDGKVICGCKKELKLISVFEENTKIIRFKSDGVVKNSYSGFLAEVFQDECPKKVKSGITAKFNGTDLKLPNEKQDLKFYSPYAKNPADVYIYSYPEFSGKDREENDFVATEDINGVLVNDVNEFNSCLEWNQAQFTEIYYGKDIKIESCRSEKTKINVEKKCMEFSDRRGFLFSPGYPFFYPGNLKICYRFSKHPGTCGVRIHFFDFRVHRSELCSDDKLIVENRAYCGIELWNKIATLDFHQRNSVELDFATTTPKCAQGFKAYYEYLPCEQIPTEAPVPPPITKILPVPPPRTDRPSQKCGGVVREETFSLTNREGSSECVFIIEKLDQDVCQIVLIFESFSLDCSTEVININGEAFCGNQNGRKVTIDKGFPVEVVYSTSNYAAPSNTFVIRGIQDRTSCLIPEPPAQLS